MLNRNQAQKPMPDSESPAKGPMGETRSGRLSDGNISAERDAILYISGTTRAFYKQSVDLIAAKLAEALNATGSDASIYRVVVETHELH